MRPRVVRTESAIRDLEAIFDYIGAGSLSAADRFLEAAEQAFALLARMPRMGRRWGSPERALKDVRVWGIPAFPNYLVFYRPVPGGIEVLHVVHGARDIDALLNDD